MATAQQTFRVAVVAETAATFVIPTSTSSRSFDFGSPAGWADYGPDRAPRAGDIVELAAGTHGPLTFTRVEGTAADPIVIRGSRAGLVTIRRVNPSSGSFVCQIQGRHWVLDGYLPSAERGCGIRILYATNASSTARDAPSGWLNISDAPAWRSAGLLKPTGFATIRYILVDGGHVWNPATSALDPTARSSNGIGIQINSHNSYKYTENQTNGVPTLFREGYLLEHNWIKNVQGEGMYMGPNWRHTTPSNSPADADDLPLRNFTVRYNRLEDIGGDCISGKCWIEGDNRIHHNTIHHGTTEWGEDGSHVVGGITGDNMSASVYCNYLEQGATPAILMYMYQMPSSLPFGPFVGEVYNNIIVGFAPCPARATADAINIGADPDSLPITGRIYNNTVVDVTGTDTLNINANATPDSFIRHNLCANATGISAGPGTASNNWIGSVAAARFVSYAERDFRLRSDSPCVDTVPNGFPSTDFYGTSRPQGSAADQGACEHSAG